jgi:predicted  nucleic acid-binding Zn ribbon protein
MNRRISINTIGYAVPQSFITKSKQRLKQHIDTVYLNNGDEFEIELYNPTQNKVLAKIEMNGKPIGNGIILRPGERVFLERYLDEAKKFLFETYVVNGNNEEVKQAIANNGDVVVKFYNEDILPIRTFYGSGNTLTINNPSWNVNHTTPFTYTTHNTLGGMSIPTHGTFTTTGVNTFYNSSLTSGTSNFSNSETLLRSTPKKSMETGRVEKGSDSNQSFTYDNSSFSSYPSTTNWWKIKPKSTQVVTKEDLVTYCTECGSKRKKDTHKFCPQCGTKF